MRIPAVLALLIPLSLAVAPAPAGMEHRGCLAAPIADPDIAASFARLEQLQSPAAARACATFLNDMSAAGDPS